MNLKASVCHLRRKSESFFWKSTINLSITWGICKINQTTKMLPRGGARCQRLTSALSIRGRAHGDHVVLSANHSKWNDDASSNTEEEPNDEVTEAWDAQTTGLKLVACFSARQAWNEKWVRIWTPLRRLFMFGRRRLSQQRSGCG